MENLTKQYKTINHLTSSNSFFQFNESLDINFLKYQYEEDIEQVALVFSIFLSATSIEFDELIDNMDQMNLEAILQKIHKIKTNFKLVGLSPLYKKLLTLESRGSLIKKSSTTQELLTIHQVYKKTYYPILLSESKKLSHYVQVSNPFLISTNSSNRRPAME